MKESKRQLFWEHQSQQDGKTLCMFQQQLDLYRKRRLQPNFKRIGASYNGTSRVLVTTRLKDTIYKWILTKMLIITRLKRVPVTTGFENVMPVTTGLNR